MIRFPRGAALTLLVLSICIQACNRNNRKVVAVIPKGNADLFWQSVHAGAAKAAGENKVDLVWDGPPNETEISIELQIVETMINRRVDAIALAPSDRSALSNVVNRAASSGIPVVIYDSAIDTDKYVSFISTDNYAAGELAGERMGQVLGSKGDIVMVKTTPGGASTTAREQGFKHVIETKYPRIHILDERFGMASVAQSLTVAENMLTAHPDLDGIFCSNESGSAGAMQAVKSRASKAKLVGFDWSPILLNALKNGQIDSLVIQNPFKMGEEAVNSCVKAIRGEKLEKHVNLPPRLITQQNLGDADVQAQVNPDLKKYLGQ